ncbi:MAG: preprotein translocase subunit SecE [Patescibacteria group bacterium]
MQIAEKFITFIHESRQEFKRVNWPDWQTTMRYTVFVIGLSVALSLFLGALDFLFFKILQFTVIG